MWKQPHSCCLQLVSVPVSPCASLAPSPPRMAPTTHPGTLLLRGGHVGRYGMVTLLHVTPPPRSRERTEIRSGPTCMKNQCHYR